MLKKLDLAHLIAISKPSQPKKKTTIKLYVVKFLQRLNAFDPTFTSQECHINAYKNAQGSAMLPNCVTLRA